MSDGIAVIRNGIVATLSSCGPFVAREISTCDFGILEGVSGCAVILLPEGESIIEPLTFTGAGNAFSDYAHWNIGGGVYIRFTGDSPKFLSKVWQAMDDIHNTIRKDRTLQSSTCLAYVKSIGFNQSEGYNVGGEDFGVVHFVIEAHDL